MSGNFVMVVVRNTNGPRILFSRLRKSAEVATKAATQYLLGNERRGLRHLAPYKYVSRKSAYGVTFFTAKQRRWFWASVKSGKIAFPVHYIRIGAIERGWQVSGSGTQYHITNRVPGVGYVIGDESQARQPAKVGHRTVTTVINNNYRGMIQAAHQAVARNAKGK